MCSKCGGHNNYYPKTLLNFNYVRFICNVIELWRVFKRTSMLQVFKVKLSNEKRDICMYIESPKKHYLKPIKLNWPEINQTFKKLTFKIEHDHFSKSSILVKMFMESRKWRKLVINPSFALWRTFHNRNQKTRISGTYPTHLN